MSLSPGIKLGVFFTPAQLEDYQIYQQMKATLGASVERACLMSRSWISTLLLRKRWLQSLPSLHPQVLVPLHHQVEVVQGGGNWADSRLGFRIRLSLGSMTAWTRGHLSSGRVSRSGPFLGLLESILWKNLLGPHIRHDWEPVRSPKCANQRPKHIQIIQPPVLVNKKMRKLFNNFVGRRIFPTAIFFGEEFKSSWKVVTKAFLVWTGRRCYKYYCWWTLTSSNFPSLLGFWMSEWLRQITICCVRRLILQGGPLPVVSGVITLRNGWKSMGYNSTWFRAHLVETHGKEPHPPDSADIYPLKFRGMVQSKANIPKEKESMKRTITITKLYPKCTWI